MLRTTDCSELLLTESAACIAYDGLDMLLNASSLWELQLLHHRLRNYITHLPENGAPQPFPVGPRDRAFLQVGNLLYQLSPEIELEFKAQAALLQSTFQ